MGCHSRKAPPKQALKVASGSVMPCSVPATYTAAHGMSHGHVTLHSKDLSTQCSMTCFEYTILNLHCRTDSKSNSARSKKTLDRVANLMNKHVRSTLTAAFDVHVAHVNLNVVCESLGHVSEVLAQDKRQFATLAV